MLPCQDAENQLQDGTKQRKYTQRPTLPEREEVHVFTKLHIHCKKHQNRVPYNTFQLGV